MTICHLKSLPLALLTKFLHLLRKNSNPKKVSSASNWVTQSSDGVSSPFYSKWRVNSVLGLWLVDFTFLKINLNFSKTCFCCSHLSHTGSEYHPYWYPHIEFLKQDFHSPNVKTPRSCHWPSASVHLYNSLGHRIHINVNVFQISQLRLNFLFHPYLSSPFCLKEESLLFLF